MMLIPLDCPHIGCRTRSSAIEIYNENLQTRRQHPGASFVEFEFFARCRKCKRGLVIVLSLSQNAASNYGQSISEGAYAIASVLPEEPAQDIPDGLPAPVETALRDAEIAYLAGSIASAAMAYRRTLERALKHLFPSAKGTFHTRIEEAAKNGHFANALVDWLHEVRVYGNDAAHELDDDPTPEEVEQAREFAMLFLTYAYTMPAKVAAARAKRSGNP